MQMQGAMREGQMSQMKIDEMLAERKEIDTFAANLKARGYTQGNKAYFTELASSRNPTRMQQGFEGLRRLEEQDQFDAYQQRQFAKRTNALAPGAPVNAMLGAPTLADLQDEARALSMLKDPRAKDELAFVREQIKQRTQPRVVGPSGSVVVEGVPTYTAPAAVPPPRQPNLATDLLIPGPNGTMVPNTALVNVRANLAREGRAQAQPVAPTITQIVDPSNPNQMITIDARRYTGGGSGSAGVIGVSGKEPSAALRENKLEAGKTLLADEISNLRRSLDVLNTLEAIPSTERGVLSNLGSSMQASGAGQFLGKVTGTEAQTERDLISSSKLRLVNAIKQATGMSAQQLNSNVELQTMLKSLSDPSQAIETNIRNLDNIETAYVKPAPVSAPRAPQTPAAAAKLYSVSTPDGKTYDFNTPAKAAEFKKAAGIK